MAVQDNKKAGFLTPIKPVEVSSSTGNPRLKDNQRVQGGQKLGGGQDNTNNAGNTGVQSQPFMSEGQSKIINKIASIGTPPSTVQPSIYNPLNNSQEQFKAGLNNSNITPNLNKVVSGSRPALVAPTPTPVAPISPAVFKEPDFSNPSISVTASPQDQRVFSTASQDRNLGESKGSGGNIQYAKDPSGNILRRDDSGNITKLGGISSIGPNGTNSDGSPLSTRDQVALDRSNQMISDWKAHQEEAKFNSLIAGRPASSQLSAIAVRNKDLTDRYQVDASRENARLSAENQAKQLAATGRKEAFDENKSMVELGFKQNENLLKDRKQMFDENAESVKIGMDSSKNMESPMTMLTNQKKLGQLTTDMVKSAYAPKIAGVGSEDELGQILFEMQKEGQIDKPFSDILMMDYRNSRQK